MSVAHQQKVASYLQVALEEGGQVLTGGTKVEQELDGGAYWTPTIITGLHSTDRCPTEEVNLIPSVELVDAVGLLVLSSTCWHVRNPRLSFIHLYVGLHFDSA